MINNRVKKMKRILLYLSVFMLISLSSCGQSDEDLYNESNRLFNLAKETNDEQDYIKAFSCYLQAAKNGYAESEFSLGTCYYFGLGTQQNNDEATKWLLKAKNNPSISKQSKMYSDEMLAILKRANDKEQCQQLFNKLVKDNEDFFASKTNAQRYQEMSKNKHLILMMNIRGMMMANDSLIDLSFLYDMLLDELQKGTNCFIFIYDSQAKIEDINKVNCSFAKLYEYCLQHNLQLLFMTDTNANFTTYR